MIDSYIAQYGRRLYGLCMSLCANPVEADDLYQETWLRVLRKIHQYDSNHPFEAWLTQICVNLYRDSLRRKKCNPFYDLFSSTEEKDNQLAAVAGEELPDYSTLYEAVKQLPDKLRITVILHYFQELDVNQTAHVLKIPPGTVKSRLSKARKLLKEVLKDDIDL